jgi:acyl-CoA thioester hydrolase
MNESAQKKIIPGAQARAKSSITSYHITSLRVPFFELDMGQAVYHGNYYHMFELAREDLLRKAGFPYREFINRQLHLSVVESRCKYRKSLHYDDRIEIHTGIAMMNSRSLTFSQLVYRLAGAPVISEEESDPGLELCTEAQLRMICVRFTGLPTLLPEDFRLTVEPLVQRE